MAAQPEVLERLVSDISFMSMKSSVLDFHNCFKSRGSMRFKIVPLTSIGHSDTLYRQKNIVIRWDQISNSVV